MAKRGNGEGSIRRRDDGRWEFKATVGIDENGKPRRLSIYGRTRKEAAEKGAKALTEYQENTLVLPSTLTVEQYLKQWLEFKAPGLKPTTRQSYEDIVNAYILPRLGKHKLTGLEPFQVARWQSALAKSGVSPRTVEYAHTLLKGALKHAVGLKVLKVSPCESVMRPKVPRSERTVWTVDEARRVLEAAKAERLYALYLLVLTAGERRGELLGTRWADVDLEKAEVHVRLNITFIHGKAHFGTPKSESGERTIPIPADLMEAFRARRPAYEKERTVAGEKWREHDLAFCSRLGTPLPEKTLRRVHERIVERAKVRRITIHEMRHSYASIALARGVPWKVVSERLGHANVNITLDIYQHLTREQHRAAALSSAELLGPEKGPEPSPEPVVVRLWSNAEEGAQNEEDAAD